MLTSGRLSDWTQAAVGSEEEMYLRMLQVAGVARDAPWTLRPLSGAELAALLPADARHPWAARTRFAALRPARVRVEPVAPAVHMVYNSGFPFSVNDGFAWTGRGLTVVARGGVALRWRAVSLRVEPEVAWTQNAAVGIVPNGFTGPQRFGDAFETNGIDAPQRFGDRPFARASLGQTTLRVDAFGLTVGASTANQFFGPALADPLVLGTNAAGFPHAFAGTARPLSVGVGTVHVRVEAGRLSQSAYSIMPANSAYRLATALSAVVSIRGVRGLELGGTRFFHGAWPADGNIGPRLRALTQSFFGVGGDPSGGAQQNQLASVWGRWVFPGAGAEVWGEFMRNDASLNTRDLLLEPDHNSGWMAGARRAWGKGDRMAALRFETLDTRVTALNRLRLQTRPYQHNIFRQGHTEAGQLLGSAAGQGGLATTVGYDRYGPGGRWTVEGARRVVQVPLGEGAPASAWDVLHYVRAERLRFGRRADLLLGVTGVAELNRNFGRDAYELRLDAGWRFGRVPAQARGVPAGGAAPAR